jgi:membrane protein CcdC involved in cytochrome C biogenesis
MRKEQGIIEIVIGSLGLVVAFFLAGYWTFLPLVIYGILSMVLIRRLSRKEVSKDEEVCIRKRNITTLICWALFAIICYFTFSNSEIGEEGKWFILSTYVFLLVHGIAFMVPVNSFANEKK